MADGGMLGKASEVNALANASTGKTSFFKADVIKPMLMGVGAGGAGVVIVRYFTKDMFRKKNTDGTLQLGANGLPQDVDGNSKFKRGGVKLLAGIVAASAIRKYSPVAALGVAVGCGVDGVADMAESKGFEYLDKWFKAAPTTTAPRTGAGMYTREVGGN